MTDKTPRPQGIVLSRSMRAAHGGGANPPSAATVNPFKLAGAAMAAVLHKVKAE